MFSDNDRISIRQTRRLLILDLFGVSSLLLPGLLAEAAGTDGIFCIGAGALLALLYLGLLGRVLGQMKGGFYPYLKEVLGGFLRDAVMLFFLFFFLLLGAFVLYQLTGLVRSWLLPEGSYGLISGLILLLAAYGTVRGIEGRARIYEILFWFLLAPLLLMLAFALRGANPDYWTPVAVSGGRGFLRGSLTVFGFFLPVVLVLFLKEHSNRPEKLLKCAGWAVGAAAVLNAAVYLMLLGNFQVKTTVALERPVITLMSMVKLPGGFFERMDALMTAIWFFSMFALMNTGVFYSGHILKELFHETRTHYGLLAVLALEFLGARWFFLYPGAEELYGSFLLYVAGPVLAALPLLLWLVGRIRKVGDGGCGAKSGEPEGTGVKQREMRKGAVPRRRGEEAE